MAKYHPAWRKELNAWMSNPHTSSMSDAMKVHAANNRHRPKVREAKMCQACGAVSIIGGERLKESNESKHGAYYCDKECAESDRGRVFRTSESYQQKITAMYEKKGLNRRQAPSCNVYFPTCCMCGDLFSAKGLSTATVCSEKCKREKTRRINRLRAWVDNRKRQTPKEVQCESCGVAFTALTRTASEKHYCSERCMKRCVRSAIKHRRREREKVATVLHRGAVSLRSQYKKHKGLCQMCGCMTEMLKEYAPHQATVDHVVPLSRGGLHVEENIQLACQKCNAKKCDRITSSRQLLLY